jgi:hypothetical protein
MVKFNRKIPLCTELSDMSNRLDFVHCLVVGWLQAGRFGVWYQQFGALCAEIKGNGQFGVAAAHFGVCMCDTAVTTQ